MMPEWWYECNDRGTAKPTESEWKLLLLLLLEREARKAFKNGRQQKMQMRIGFCLLQLLPPHTRKLTCIPPGPPPTPPQPPLESVNHSCFDYSRRSDIFSCTSSAEIQKKGTGTRKMNEKPRWKRENPNYTPFSCSVCCCHIIPFFNKI